MKCPSCGYENSDEARYCGLCQKPFTSFVREPSAPYGLPLSLKPKKEAVQAAQQVLKSRSAGENWFQRHLNWTWVLAICGAKILVFVAVVVFLYSVLDPLSEFTISSFLSFLNSLAVIALVFTVLYLLATFGVGAWVLKRKNQSQLWLLILLIPFAVASLPPLFSFHFSNLVPHSLFSLFGSLSELVDVIVIVCFLRLKNHSELPALPVSAESSGSFKSSNSIQPGLAPQGLGYRPEKYGP